MWPRPHDKGGCINWQGDEWQQTERNRFQHVQACSDPGKQWGNNAHTHARTPTEWQNKAPMTLLSNKTEKKWVTQLREHKHFQLLPPEVTASQRRCVSFNVWTTAILRCGSRGTRCAPKCMQHCSTGCTCSAAYSVLGGVVAHGGVSPEIRKCKLFSSFADLQCVACVLAEGWRCPVGKQVDDVMRNDVARPECNPGVSAAYKRNYCHWQQISLTGQKSALSLLAWN